MAKADLTYFIGRRVEGVEQSDDGWTIKLEGGAEIRNKNKRRKMPKEDGLTGAAFLRPLVDEEGKETTLQFGQNSLDGPLIASEVKLTPDSYAISDPDFTGGMEIYPEVEDEPEPEIPHPDERIQESVSIEYLDEQVRIAEGNLTVAQEALERAQKARADASA